MYRKFYGLTGKPFQLTPDLKFLYPSANHKRALSYLRYGLEQGEGFVVITGHIGTGKTLLIQALLAELADQEIATARIAAANLGVDNVLAAVSAALGRPYEGKSRVALLKNLERSLLHARDYLDGVLLIVDEAQTLSPGALEELRILSNLEAGGQALLQVFLIGQTELRNTLNAKNMEQLRQRIVVSHHLAPLSLEDTKRYIGYRLVAVGWSGNPAFTPAVYDEVYGWTGGIPRKINLLMDRALVYGFLEELRSFDAGDIAAVMEEMSQEMAGDLVGPGEPGEQETLEGSASVGHATEESRAPRESSNMESRLRALEAKLDKLSNRAGNSNKL